MFTCLQVTARASKGKCQRGLVNLNLQFFEVVSCFTLIGFISFIGTNSPPSCMERVPWSLSNLKWSQYVISLFELTSFAKTLSLHGIFLKNFCHYFINLFCCFILYRAILSWHPIGSKAHASASKKDHHFKQEAELRYNS